jgi:hypothetical protein
VCSFARSHSSVLLASQVLQLLGNTSKQQLDLSVAVSRQLPCTQPTWVHDVCLVPWTADQSQQPQQEEVRHCKEAGCKGLLVVAACLHNSVHCWAVVPPSVASITQKPSAPATSAGESAYSPPGSYTTGAWQGHYAGTWQCDKQQMLYSMSLGVAAGQDPSGQQVLWVAAGGILREVCCWHLPLQGLQEAAAAAVRLHVAQHVASSSSSAPNPLLEAPALLSAGEVAKAVPEGQSPAQHQQQQQVACWMRPVPVAAVLQGHEGSVHQVRWVIPGRLLVSTSDDRSARVWRLQDTGELGVACTATDVLGTVCFESIVQH